MLREQISCTKCKQLKKSSQTFCETQHKQSKYNGVSMSQLKAIGATVKENRKETGGKVVRESVGR